MKNFDEWNEEKKQVELIDSTNFEFNEREIWWCSLGVNVGDEEDGKNTFHERPVLILRKFNKRMAWIIPTTTKIKANPFYYPIAYHGKSYCVMLSQLRLISTKRLRWKLVRILEKDFNNVLDAVICLMKKNSQH